MPSHFELCIKKKCARPCPRATTHGKPVCGQPASHCIWKAVIIGKREWYVNSLLCRAFSGVREPRETRKVNN